ncbi:MULTISPECIES: ABC transporter permease [Gordonia]|jgi:ABC-2 type transport system permease protein|uniref:ABC transporter permease protein n=1 Tax=Gordonia malaquae NBRC 108250 TaxID=1223542 RepID=M3T8Y0_GORML|nr:ABC transporter permease [Gordonia malaquae]GAC77881.1 hypothetical protein GM1_001_00040 [Gordonia malaquae NBRC 108250]SED83084.1 ABC-2 family transporter protein [Gordonia malaquae]
MSVAAAPAPVTGGSGIPLSRLVKVELRKLVDTRASFWLSISIAVIAAIIAVVVLIVGSSHPEDVTFDNLFNLMTAPMAFLLPVMAILLVTSEWSQRNALTTFTMEPRRERIVAAKFVAVMLAAVAAVVVALVLGAVANLIGGLIYGDPAGSWEITGVSLFAGILGMLIGVLMGFAFAALFLNTPAAIVVYFIVPTVLQIIGGVIPWFRENLLDWIDVNTAQMPLLEGDWPTGSEWMHIVVACIIWIVLPLAFGVNRIMRSEIK